LRSSHIRTCTFPITKDRSDLNLCQNKALYYHCLEMTAPLFIMVWIKVNFHVYRILFNIFCVSIIYCKCYHPIGYKIIYLSLLLGFRRYCYLLMFYLSWGSSGFRTRPLFNHMQFLKFVDVAWMPLELQTTKVLLLAFSYGGIFCIIVYYKSEDIFWYNTFQCEV
jgi:hypothetical protein